MLVCLYLLQTEGITSSEQAKITSPNDTKAILKHVSCYIVKIVYHKHGKIQWAKLLQFSWCL